MWARCSAEKDSCSMVVHIWMFWAPVSSAIVLHLERRTARKLQTLPKIRLQLPPRCHNKWKIGAQATERVCVSTAVCWVPSLWSGVQALWTLPWGSGEQRQDTPEGHWNCTRQSITGGRGHSSKVQTWLEKKASWRNGSTGWKEGSHRN
jgi:hypothetical protein